MRHIFSLAVFSAVSALAAQGCSSSSSSPPAPPDLSAISDDCDPLVPEHCGYPLPNDFWTASDSAGKTHLAFGATTLPINAASGKRVDPATWNAHDGWSPGEELVTYLAGATATGLAGQDNMALSVTTDSPTVIIDASTGELVGHFAEIDMSTFRSDDQSLLIHPAARLKDKTRYVVAVRHVVDDAGKPIAASPAFAALRDNVKTNNAKLEGRRAHFENDIFALLASKGIGRSDLQVAWDFTTASRENNTRDLLSMRDQALAAVGDQGPTYTFTNVEMAPNPYLSLRITGTMTVPLFLDQPGPGATITRGPDGAPKQNGTAQYQFLMLVPKTIPQDGTLGIIQNGHGLLGAMTEGQDGYFAAFCESYGYVGIAVDWVGMAHDDSATLTVAASTDIGAFERAVDRQHQGFVNALLAMRMMKGRMTSEPLLMRSGKTILDPTRAYYRGDSQGGIFGTTYMSISTDVTRGLLGEPGVPYTLLLDRSVDFSGFRFLLKGSYQNGLDLRIILALLQMSWDRTEPDGYVPYIRANMLPGTPAHDVLIHDAIGDHQVSPLGAHLLARTIGAKNLKPVNRSLWGIDEVDSLPSGSAMVEFDFGNPPSPVINLPPTGPEYGEDPHDAVRVLKPATDQADHFFRTGEIKPFCDGPCNPT